MPGKALVLRADYPDEDKNKLFIYRIEPCAVSLEENAQDIYVAVPNGKCISVNNIPEGLYGIEMI